MVLYCGSALKSDFVEMAPRDEVIEPMISISNLLSFQVKTKKEKTNKKINGFLIISPANSAWDLMSSCAFSG